MTRSLMLALLGLVLAGSPALAAKRGASASGQAPAARTAATKPALAGQGRVVKARQTARRSRPARAPGLRHAVRWQAAPVVTRLAVARDSRAASANGACLGSRGVSRCRVQTVMGGSVAGWASGLAPAAGVQADECPAGTMATLARGHEDIIRCMPI